MSDAGIYRGWNYRMRVAVEADGRASKYSIHFYRQSGAWFDEIRYDSHDRHHGKKMIAPHFHMKLRSSFKNDSAAALEEIKSMIDNDLQKIHKVIET